MKEKRKYPLAEKVMIVFCSAAMLLMMASIFIDTEISLFNIALLLNGVGIMAFVFGKKSDQVE